MAFALLILALGALGFFSPARIVTLAERVQTRAGLFAATAIRAVAGVALLLAADASRAPLYFQICGVAAIVAALSIPLIGLRRLGVLIRWWTARPPAFLRVWAVTALAIGASFLWALAP
jgi:hypothetical protein